MTSDDEYELDYDVQEVHLSDKLVFKVTTVANEALPLEMLLDLEEKREEISGQRLWEGSLLLCEYIVRACKDKELELHGRSVLELGAGTGIAGMLAHSLGAAPTIITDGDDRYDRQRLKFELLGEYSFSQSYFTVFRWAEQPRLMEGTLRKIAFHPRRLLPPCSGDYKASVQRGSWPSLHMAGRWGDNASNLELLGKLRLWRPGDRAFDSCPIGGGGGEGERTNNRGTGLLLPPAPPPLPPPPPPVDLIIAGDVLYKPELLAPLMETARTGSVRGGGMRMLLCHVPRAGVTYGMVEEALTSAGFSFEVVGSGAGGCVEGGFVGGVEVCVDYASRARLYSIAIAQQP
ncbi:unnamed protein product [Discosporangium mesarthrocarpum]